MYQVLKEYSKQKIVQITQEFEMKEFMKKYHKIHYSNYKFNTMIVKLMVQCSKQLKK